MGWAKKVDLALAIFLALSVLLFSSVDSTNFDCDLNQKYEQINISVSDTYASINVLNLNSPNAQSPQCSWNISFGINKSFLELSRVVLAPTDTLAITGYHVDSGNKTSTIELYNGTGSPYPGLISTETCNYVIVNLLLSKDLFARTYSTVAYWKSDIQLTKDSGLLAFPLTNDQKTTINNAFTLQPSIDFSDRVTLLNFTQLPKTYSFTVNGQAYSNTNPPTTFLQTTSPLAVEFKNYTPSDIPILTTYYLVSANCSGNVILTKVGDTAPIAVPNEDYRKQQKISSIKCAQLFTSPDKTKFQVLIDPKQDGLANSGDSVTLFNPSGSIELSLNEPALMYFRTIDNYLTEKQYLVVYDSPYAANTKAKFIAPLMKVISNEEAAVFMLTDKEQTVPVPGDGKTSSKIVHTLYPANLASSGRVVAQFEQVSLTPGQMSISIYGSEDISAKPLVTLGQSNRLPLAISGNAPTMRVVFEGKVSALKVTYRLAAPGQSCQYLSTVTPTFEVKGGESSSICSWYIPPTNLVANHTVINPTILKIPQGKVLNVATFGTKSSTVSYPGPINEFYFPDMIWKNDTAYEFSIDVSNVTKDDLHLLFVQKSDYLNEQIALQSNKKLSTIQSPNYPGFYPVGLTENWVFTNEPVTKDWALLTIEDVHLKADHQLTLLSKEAGNLNWKGDVNLSEVSDYLVHYPFSFSLDSNSYNLTSFSNRGFRVSLKYPGIADDLSITGKGVIGFNSLNNVTSNPINIWRVTANDKSKLWSDSILRINVSLADTLDKTKAKLSIYDSISLREQSLHQPNGSINGTTGFFVGSIKSVFIVYDYSESLTTKANFSLEFTITAEKCAHENHKNYSALKCATTDRCITDEMICNGINECGDFTDELYCSGNQPAPPTPPTPASSGGVNTLVVIFILMPLSAVLGILGYIYIPQFLLRIRRGRYSEFRDLSEVS